MDLLDLPPEIFQNIMYHYIKMHKVESIPEILFVHRAFNVAITDNLMLYMPRGIYSFKLGYKFYKAQFSLILQARVKQARRNEELNGVYPFLPKYVNKVVNRVYKTAGLQDVSDNIRDRDEANLCDAMIDYFKYADGANESGLHRLMLDERAANMNLKKEFGTTLSQATVAAAAAISGRLNSIENSIKSHIEAIAKLVKQENMWQTSAAFGTPFNAAVSSGSEAIVVRALEAVRDMAPSPNSAVVDALLNGLGTSLHRGRTTMALDILRDGSTHFPKVKAYTFKLWLDKAMAIGDLSLLDTILGLNHSAGRPGLGDSFVKACKNGQDSILGVFFGQDLLNINDYVNVSKATMSPTHCYPIMAAIRCAPSAAARAVLVTRLLELGANPNGPKKPIGMQVSAIPLAVAAEKNCCATVEVLLANGADLMMPTARDSEWNAKFGVLRDIKNLLRTAPNNEFRYKVEQALKLEESLPVAPLVLAVRNRCWGAVAYLLKKGVDLTMPTGNMGATGEWRAVVDIIYGQFNDEPERDLLPDHVWQTLDAIRRQLASTHEPWPVYFHRPVSYGTAASTHEPWPVSYHRPVSWLSSS